MSIWDTYENRAAISGRTKRDAFLNRERRLLNTKQQDNLSYHRVIVDGIEKCVTITNTQNHNEKTIISKNHNDFRCGSYIEWMNNYWLITEYDANTEVYTKATMVQCNYLLKWIDNNGNIHEQWCIIEDGTKYMTGEYEDRNFIVTRGDSRLIMIIAKNEHTTNFTRESRFLIDDPDADTKLSYALTKPLKVGLVYNTDGVYSFVLQEVSSTEDDNHELSLADYYKYYPKHTATHQTEEPDNADENTSGKTRWF